MASLEEAFILVSSNFKIPSLNYHQRLAIQKIVEEKGCVTIPITAAKETTAYLARFAASDWLVSNRSFARSANMVLN